MKYVFKGNIFPDATHQLNFIRGLINLQTFRLESLCLWCLTLNYWCADLPYSCLRCMDLS